MRGLAQEDQIVVLELRCDIVFGGLIVRVEVSRERAPVRRLGVRGNHHADQDGKETSRELV